MCKKVSIYILFLLLPIFGVLTVHIKNAEAHSVEYKIIKKGSPVVLSFFYSSGEPFSYANALVWEPNKTDIEFQNGRTDKNGCFSFKPDKNGVWKVDVEDGMGHKKTATLNINSILGVNQIEKEKKPFLNVKTLGALFSISLIFNLAIIPKLFKG